MNYINIAVTSKTPYNTTDTNPSLYSSNITFSLLPILDDLQSMNYSGKGKDKGKEKFQKPYIPKYGWE